jgi:septum formation protein
MTWFERPSGLTAGGSFASPAGSARAWPAVPSRRFVLASASPARRRLLEQAGFAPEVLISGVDEEGIDEPDPSALVLELARRKATAVAATMSGEHALIIGCDSLLDVDGAVQGKPASIEAARDRLRALRGRAAILRTGHFLIDAESGATASGVDSTVVRFGEFSNAELDAYLAHGDALEVAGAFTLEGRSAPFLAGIEGAPSNVVGLSLPLLRRLLLDLGVSITELWA